MMGSQGPAATGDPAFDPLIHPPHRLRICAALEPWDEYEFSALREVVGVSDSVLSKQLAILMDARYVAQRRATREGRQRVSLRLTDEGRRAFAGHVRALRNIVGRFDAAEANRTDPGVSPRAAAVGLDEAAIGAEPGESLSVSGVKG
jgi:DNA-binding MarR family transcriptional regulator